MADTAPQAAQGTSLAREASTALVDAWKTVRKRWLWVVTLATAVVVAVGFYTAGLQRIYRSSCILQIDPKPPKPLGQDVQAVVDLGATGYFAEKSYYRTQFKIIRSRTVSEETVRRLGLHRDPAFLQHLSPGQPPRPEGTREVTVEAAAGILRANLGVEPVKESRLVNISYRDANPERARQILSTLVSVYSNRNVDVALDSTNTAAEWLRGQVDKLKEELEESELALHEYKRGNRILSVSLQDQSNMLRQEIQQLSAALTAVKVRRAQVAAQVEEIGEVGSGLSNGNAELLRDESIRALRAELVTARAEQDSLISAGKAVRHPLVASAIARVQVAQEALDTEIRNVRKAAQKELAVVDHEIQGLTALLREAQQRAQDLGRLEIDYRRLERSKTNTEKLYSLVIERSKESDLTRMMRFNNIQLIDPPTVPKAPVSPRVPFNIALGLFGGVALGLFAAFAREMLDQSVRSPQDLDELGLVFLGLIPRFNQSGGPKYGRKKARRRRKAEPGRIELIVHEDPTSGMAEAARGVRTNLAFMSPDKPYKTFLVTSAGPEEGKTTVACCLATAMAQAGNRVVLVDCDLRRPRVHKVFGRKNDRGVTTAIVDRSKLDDALWQTEVPDLSLLVSGPSRPNPAESLQSNSFQELLAALLERFDRVVIDSPPVGAVTDAVVLSTRVDATVMVVRALTSMRDNVKRCHRTLMDVRANLVGTVLNAADPTRQGYAYYHYYGSGEEGSSEGGASEGSELKSA